MARRKRDWLEWSANVLTAGTIRPKDEDFQADFDVARYKGPPIRVKRAMLVYVQVRDARRFKRLQSDYAWLRSVVAEMDLNPDDARFLL